MAEPRVLQSKTNPGQFAIELPGGGMQSITAAQAESLLANKGLLETVGDAASLSSANLVSGARSLLGNEQAGRDLATGREQIDALSKQNAPAAFIGQAAPAALGGGVGAMGGRLGILGTEAAMGAAYMPEAPLAGAALGAAIPSVAMGIGPAARAVGSMANNLPVPGIGMGIGGGTGPVNPNSIAAMGTTRMADRVAHRVGSTPDDFIGPPSPRILKGYAEDSFFDQNNIPLAPSQRMGLRATTADDILLAKRTRWAEDVHGTTPAIIAQQKQGFTEIVKQRMGATGPANLTDEAVTDAMQAAGGKINQLTGIAGPIDLPKDAMTRARAVVRDADSTHAGALGNLVDDMEKALQRGGGQLDPTDAQVLLTRLGSKGLGASGGSYAKMTDAGAVREIIEDAVAARLTGAEREALQNARYQWKLGDTLQKTGVRDSAGMVNPKSFAGNWDRKTAKKYKGKDDLARLGRTFSYLTDAEATAGSTLQRVFANAPGVAGNIAKQSPGLIGGSALGTAVISGLLGGG